MRPSPALDQQVRDAAGALARAGLVHAYGHCSARIDQAHFLVCAAGPLGLVGRRPGVVCPVAGALPEGVLGEVRAHQAVYSRRQDVGGVCRIMPPALMALSALGVTPRPRHGVGAYFAPSPPLWDDPRLLRDDERARGLADALGEAPAIVMRGNGAVVVGETLPQAVTLAWFLEDAARVEERIRSMGANPQAGILTPDEIQARQGFAGDIVERMWAYLTDPSRIGAFDGGR
jgi:HCOMODA/2-hydroxy-3-carboxy-muconic semialdehyde decarboxylase